MIHDAPRFFAHTPPPPPLLPPEARNPCNVPRHTHQVKVLYQRAIELKKEGRTAEAMACLKRAKSLEADLLRDAQGKGLVGIGDREGGDGSRRPSLLRQGSSRRSSAATAASAAGAEPSGRKDSR